MLLLALGLLAGYPVARIATAPEKGDAAKSGNVAPGSPASLQSEDCKPENAPAPGNPPHSWCEPVRVLREFFGLAMNPRQTRGESLGEVAAQAKESDYVLRFMVALVPAPPDPRLDQ